MNRYIMGFFSVFPACAGVIPDLESMGKQIAGIPRMRGGDPNACTMQEYIDAYSPHARG